MARLVPLRSVAAMVAIVAVTGLAAAAPFERSTTEYVAIREVAAAAVQSAETHNAIRAGAAALSASYRPLAAGVSVLVDAPYTLLNSTEIGFGCPPSLTIAGPLTLDNATFVLPPSRLSVDGATCAGATPEAVLVGLTGATLIDVARRAEVDISDLLEVDPQAALAFVLDGPITCGTVVKDDGVWTFVVVEDVPALFISNPDDPAASCTLADISAATSAASLTSGGLSASSLAASSVVRHARVEAAARLMGRVEA
ncbi:hypothetical protein MMPV_001771 [Pyropia vietnamensis]